jgi:hypothetical protein
MKGQLTAISRRITTGEEGNGDGMKKYENRE